MKMIEKYKSMGILSENAAFEYMLASLKDTIRTYDFFVAWEKVLGNVSQVEVSLNIMNSLIGKDDISKRLKELIKEYPQIVSVIPILIAVRGINIKVAEVGGDIEYSFAKRTSYSDDEIFALSAVETVTVEIPDTFTLTLSSGIGGSITTGESGLHRQDDVISIAATPNDGYRFGGWIATYGTFADPSNASTTFTMPANDTEIRPIFYLVGDLDGDGMITMADAMILFDYLSGVRILTPEQRRAADIDGDGFVTMADAMILFDFLSGLRQSLF